MCLGIPGELMAIHERDGLRFGQVRFGDVTREVCLAYQPDARVGDYVLVHVGFAISIIDDRAAERTWHALRELGATDELGEEPEPQ